MCSRFASGHDNATLHVFGGRSPIVVGDEVTIGHGAIVHGATVGDRVLIGMGAIVLDGVEIGADCLIGAGSLVTPGTRIAAGLLVLGSPARALRALTGPERDSLRDSAARYVGYAAEYRAAGLR
jgi:carbonic anhydrase/acetyltransferase-like protein (isoleucine patch superfamily)